MEIKTALLPFGLFARGGSAAELVEVTMETSLDIDGEQPLAMAYEKGDREIVQLAERHYDVDITGYPKDCRVVAQSGQAADVCSKALPPFLPIEKPEGLTLKNALSRAVVK